MVRPREYAGRAWMGAGHAEAIPSDPRYAKPDAPRRPPMGIDQALRENCHIQGKRYFIAVLQDDGSTVTTYSAPHRMPDQAIPSFFNEDRFIDWAQSSGMAATTPSSFESGPGYGLDGYNRSLTAPDYPLRAPHPRRRGHGPEGYEAEMVGKTRKRQRGGPYRPRVDGVDDEPRATVSNTKKALRIGNSPQVLEVYDQRFRSLQQTACKIVAKAWVKLVEPKKQSTHPYTGQEARQPNWWPDAWGTGEKDKVRHKEPDHLWKFERLHLLAHILSMLVLPNERQHQDIRKLNLSVSKLEEVTMETLSSFFTDKTSPQNAKKKKYLVELFRVAKAEERFHNGEIDAETIIWVSTDEKTPDDDEDCREPRAADEEGCLPPGPSHSGPLKPDGTAPVLTSPNSDHSSSGALHTTPFLESIPVRGSHFNPMLPQNVGPNQHGYVENSGLGANGQGTMHAAASLPMQHELCATSHDASRRSSFLGSAGEYGGSSGSSIYSNWQQGTTAAGNPSMYSFTPHQQPQPPPPSMPTFLPQPSVPMSSHQYMDAPFDSLHRASYDQNPNGVFRPNIPPEQVTHAQGFPAYVTSDGRAISSVHVKDDDLDRNHLH